MLSPKGIDRFHKLSILIKNTKNPFKKWKLYYNYMHNPTDTGVEWYILLKNEK